MKVPAGTGPAGMIRAMGVRGMPDLDKIKPKSTVLREETIEVDGQKHDCWVIESRVDTVAMPAMPGASMKDMLTTTWMDKKLGIDLKNVVSVKMEMGGHQSDMHMQIVKSSLKIDEPVDEALFRFTPPADAKQVPELLGAMPKVDLSGKDAPAFEVKGLDARPYTLAALKGKPILLDFWATWCGPCRASMPVVEKLYHEYQEQGLAVIAIDAGEERDTVASFLKANPIPYSAALSADTGVLEAFQVTAYPTFVLIGRDGKIVAHQVGYGGEASLRAMFEKAGLTKPAAK
jgi:thiol-disulfide isomerase/thioredoxin